jgi:hypothetical protein
MPRRRPTWAEKLAADKGLPKVVKLTPPQAKRWGGATLAIPAPREVDGLMRTVPAGRVTTIDALRTTIARTHHAAAGCPVTTGIFAAIAARAADEAERAGATAITPYWRTLKKGGELNPKYPGGVAGVRRRLAAEGHAFTRKGPRTFVRDLPAVLYSPSSPSW